MRRDLYESILTREESRAADEHSIHVLGMSGIDLMKRAGDAVAEHALATLPPHIDPLITVPFVVFCGAGNNGGDGFICARRLWEMGHKTLVLATEDPAHFQGDAKLAFQHFLHVVEKEGFLLPTGSSPWQAIIDVNQVKNQLDHIRPLVIVDALFGTGLNRALIGKSAAVVETINQWRQSHTDTCRVLAVDIPSGLSVNGDVLSGPHIFADSTVTFSTRKIAHVSEPNTFSCGEVSCKDIGIISPPVERGHVGIAALLKTNQPARSLMKPVLPYEFKGNFAHVAVLEGSPNTKGASRLASRAALRAGAGLVTLLVNDTAIAPGDCAEMMKRKIKIPVPSNLLERISVLVIGPGLGTDAKSMNQAFAVLKLALKNNIPVVLDAGGLSLLGKLKNIKSHGNIIFATPHPGEAARLLGVSAQAVQNDRVRATHHLTDLTSTLPMRVIWVLKGACPIVAEKQAATIVCQGGVRPLAVGGTGDVLSGTIAGLWGRTEDAFDCAILSVSAHLAAGRYLEQFAERGHLASEIADALASVLYPSGD